MFPSTGSSGFLNKGTGVEDHLSFYSQISPFPHPSFPSYEIHHTFEAFNNTSVGEVVASHLKESLPSIHPKQRVVGCDGGGSRHFGHSCQTSTTNRWPWVQDDYHHNNNNTYNNSSTNINGLSVGGMRMKKVKGRRKVREPRFCFKTMSAVDVLDDGYKWRKYGQKVVKNTQHPRSYYRCTQNNCRVKKRVERLAEDTRMVITTYEGRHVHSPSNDGDETQASSQINFFW